jgi:hypothetical protein
MFLQIKYVTYATEFWQIFLQYVLYNFLIFKGSDDGLQHSELLSVWNLSIVSHLIPKYTSLSICSHLNPKYIWSNMAQILHAPCENITYQWDL